MDDNKWCPGFKCLSREARRYTEQKFVQGEIHGTKHKLVQGDIYKSVQGGGRSVGMVEA